MRGAFIAGVLVAAAAWADDTERARQAYTAGSSLVSQGRFAEAIEQFTLANRLAPHPLNVFNIAQCYRSMGEGPRALAAFRSYLRDAAAGTAQRPVAEQAVEALQRDLAARGVQQVTVVVSPATAPADVVVDERPLGKAPATTELTAGVHQVRVTAAGYAPFSARFSVGLERASDLPITLQPLGGDATAGTTPPAPGAAPPAGVAKSTASPAASSAPTLPYAFPADAPVVGAAPAIASPAPQSPGSAPPMVTAEGVPVGAGVAGGTVAASPLVPGPPGVAATARKPVVGAWIATGGAALGVGLGVTFAVLSLGAQNALRSPPVKSFSDNQKLYQDGVAFQTVSIISFAIAGAAAVTALILFLVEGR